MAVGKGTVVYPHRWPDPDVDAFAAAHDAVRAARRHEVTTEHPWSLSPSHLLAAPAAARLVLPSPNGSTIAAALGRAESGGVTVVAGCLRNAGAVGRWLAGRGLPTEERPLAIIAAGEKWSTGELRPALEDLLGGRHHRRPRTLERDPARVPLPRGGGGRRVWRAERHHLAETLHRSATGRHLTEGGHAPDIDVAAQFDAQDTVPILVDGAFHRYLRLMDLTYPPETEPFRVEVRELARRAPARRMGHARLHQTPEERKAFNAEWAKKLSPGGLDLRLLAQGVRRQGTLAHRAGGAERGVRPGRRPRCGPTSSATPWSAPPSCSGAPRSRSRSSSRGS